MINREGRCQNLANLKVEDGTRTANIFEKVRAGEAKPNEIRPADPVTNARGTISTFQG